MTRISLTAIARLLLARGAAVVVAASLLTGQSALAAPVQAATFGTTGSFNNGNYTTGWEFSISTPIVVTHLGRVDMQDNGITTGDVGLWAELDGAGNSLITQVTVTSTSPSEPSGTGHSTYYESITPVTLAPGNYIVATQRNGEPFYYNQAHSTAPGITWVEGEAAAPGALPLGSSAFTIDRNDIGSYFGASFKFEGAAPPPLVLSAPTGRAVLQRDDANTADMTVAGTYGGSVTRIEARAVPRAGFSGIPTGWQVIDNAPSGGAFSGSLVDVVGGWYDIEVKTFDGATQVGAATVERIGVGEVFITAGQSNSANHGSPQQQPSDDRVSAATSVSATTWQHASDPQPIATGGGGSPWPQLGDLIAAAYDVPVGFVSVGVGATSVSQWLPGSSNYDTRLRAAIQALGPDGFRSVLWHQGESDSLAGTSAGDYAARLQQIIAQSRIDAGFDVPWGVALASYHPGSSSANEAQVIAGQQQVIAADWLVFEGAFTDDFHLNGWLSDSVHFNQTGLDEHALRWSEQIRSAGIIAISEPIPEPATLFMLTLAVAGVGGYARRRWRPVRAT